MSDKKKATPLSDLGEFGLIEHITANISLKNPGSIKGVGDDAAVLDYGGKRMVVTTDLLVEGIHFNLVYTPLKHLGYKCVVVNLSDVYAMNAIPRQITVSIAISGKYSTEAVDELYSGIMLACEQYGVDLVGGDTSSSVTGMCISITALGEVETGKTVYRNTARLNDLICVSGNLGASYMGLQLLERERKLFEESGSGLQPDLSGYEYLLSRQLKPEARRDVIEALDKEGLVPTSMIDISDGLSSDLIHICNQSGLGCRIFQDKIPIDKETAEAATEMNIEPFICALNGGEDYELLFTVPLEAQESILKIPSVSLIGHMTDAGSGCKFVTLQGAEMVLHAGGWNSLV